MTLSAFREWLEVLAEAHVMVPASEVLARCPTLADGAGDSLAALDVESAGRALGRSCSTVRDYCRAGLLEGAYRQRGREWRIPPDAIRAFQRRESESTAPAVQSRTTKTADLSAWRSETDAA